MVVPFFNKVVSVKEKQTSGGNNKMAISKQEARNYISEDEKSEIDLLERRVDLMLRHKGLMTLTLGEHFFSKLSGRGIGELFERYEAAGWEIEYISDREDGNYYKFK